MIIGIAGKKHSGKSTAAEILKRELGYETRSFADKLKQICAILIGCSADDFENYEFKENTKVPQYLRNFSPDGNIRSFIQYFGTEVMRGVSDSIWIDLTLNNSNSNLIISDCRFVNESIAIIEKGGIIIKIERDNDNTLTDNHLSETELDMIVGNITVENNSSLEEFEKKIKKIADSIKLL